MSLRGILAVALAAVVVAVGLRAQTELGGGVWGTHVAAGQALLAGELTMSPGYPIWGLSLLAVTLGEGVLVAQVVLLVALLCWWLPGILRPAARRGGALYRTLGLGNPVVLVVVLAPWILLALTYYSNAASALLGWLAAWGMLEASRRDGRAAWFAIAGVVLGLAANFRSENLLLAALLAAGLGVRAFLDHDARTGLVRAAAVLGGTFVVMIPWLVYTQQTLGTPRLTSTNGGGVRYLGLGVLPDNPWGVQADDQWVHEVAQAEVGAHAFTAPADALFAERFREAVAAHPVAFARRVLRGWRLALTQGLEVPPARSVVDVSPDDARLADYLNERLKDALGLAVNRRELAAYEAEGLSMDDLSARHYLLVLAEYAVRGVWAAVFLALLSASVVAVWRLGPRRDASWVWLAYVGAWLAVAGGIQTLPRHTTTIVPALVTVVALAAARPDRSRGASEPDQGVGTPASRA